MPGQVRFVLASASPRRRDLLAQIGRIPDAVIAPDVDETVRPRELPAAHAARLAREKCDAAAAALSAANSREGGSAAAGPEAAGAYILAADTVVACGRRILPKAEDEAAARRCLALLSGRRHRVIGGICLRAPDGTRHERVVTTAVAFARLGPAEIDAYIASGEWRGKAGGYAIQGRAAVFVRRINGSYSNVVGLALFETERLLAGCGLGLGSGGGEAALLGGSRAARGEGAR